MKRISDQELLDVYDFGDKDKASAIRQVYDRGRYDERRDQESRELGAAENAWADSIMSRCRVEPSSGAHRLTFGVDGGPIVSLVIDEQEFAEAGLRAMDAMVRRAIGLAWTGRPAFADVSGLGFCATAHVDEQGKGVELMFRSREARRAGQVSRQVVIKLDEDLARETARRIDAIYQPAPRIGPQDFADIDYLRGRMYEQGVAPLPWESIPDHPAAVEYALEACRLVPLLLSDMADALEKLRALQWTGHSFRLDAEGNVREFVFVCPFCGAGEPGPHATRSGPGWRSGWCWFTHWQQTVTDPARRRCSCYIRPAGGSDAPQESHRKADE